MGHIATPAPSRLRAAPARAWGRPRTRPSIASAPASSCSRRSPPTSAAPPGGQLVTWNDDSEASEVSPSSGTQWALFDLNAYYVAWFKTGEQPPIVRDAIDYSHRLHATTAEPDLMLQTSIYEPANGSTPADEIELLAFLTAPATLEIEVDGTTESTAAPAGIQSLRVPLREGTPKLRIVRDGATVAEVDSAFPISNTIVYQDMLYRSGGSLPCDRGPLLQ